MCDFFDDDDGLIEFRDREHLALFLAHGLETGDATYAARTFGVVMRAYGVDRMARETGLSAEHLARSFGDQGDPTLSTLLAVMKALDVLLTARVKGEQEDD